MLRGYQDAEYSGFRADNYFQRVLVKELRRTVVPKLRPGAKILDVGCGNGVFIEMMQSAGFEATGVDVSETIIGDLRGRGLNAHSGDFLTMNLPMQFEFISMWDLVEHLTSPKAFISRACSLLSPGGCCC